MGTFLHYDMNMLNVRSTFLGAIVMGICMLFSQATFAYAEGRNEADDDLMDTVIVSLNHHEWFQKLSPEEQNFTFKKTYDALLFQSKSRSPAFMGENPTAIAEKKPEFSPLALSSVAEKDVSPFTAGRNSNALESEAVKI